MTARTAFDLLLQCAKAREMTSKMVRDAALDAVVETLASEIRHILTPDEAWRWKGSGR